MPQQHLFVTDPLASLNLRLDSSLRMACELAKLGARVYLCGAETLAWQSGEGSAHGLAQRLSFRGGDPMQPELAPAAKLLLSECQGIHMRKEPPFNASFIAATWLLDSARRHSHIFNSPEALRSLNEKLAIFRFPDLIEPALVSSRAEELLAFISERCGGDAIVKPLDLFGGRGIIRLELQGMSSEAALARLDEATVNGTQARLVQPFNRAIFAGEVRVFAIGGEPWAWCLKKPQAGNFFANTSAGATLLPFSPSPGFAARVRAVAQALLQQGVSLVGFDFIGEALSEINITSPRLLQAPGDNENYYAGIATWLAERCAEPL